MKRGLAGVVGLALLAGCGGGRVTPLPPAAEPAMSPPLTATPAGRVIDLPPGAEPEGLAVDGVTHTVAVGLRRPDRLALLDTASLALRLVAVPGAARHLALLAPGGPLLLPGEDSDLLLRVSLPDGTADAGVKVGRQPHDAAAVGGRVADSDELAGAVTVTEGPRTLARFPAGVQTGGVAAAGSRVAAVDVRGERVYTYDLTTLRTFGSLPAGTGPTHVVGVDARHVVVTDTVGGQLFSYDLSGTPRQVGKVPLAGRPYGIGADPLRHRVWVAASASNTLQRYDVAADGTLRLVGPALPTIRGAYSVAVDPADGTVYLAGVNDSQLEVITP